MDLRSIGRMPEVPQATGGHGLRPTAAPRRGIALITVLLVLLFFFLVTFGLSTFSVVDRKASLDSVRAMQAYYVADAGISYASFLYRSGKAVVGVRDFTARTKFIFDSVSTGVNFGVPGTFGFFDLKSFECVTSDPDADVPENPGNKPTLRIRSVGSLYQGDSSPAACPAPPCAPPTWQLLAQRTIYAKIALCTPTDIGGGPIDPCARSTPCTAATCDPANPSPCCPCDTASFRPVTFYEKFR